MERDKINSSQDALRRDDLVKRLRKIESNQIGWGYAGMAANRIEALEVERDALAEKLEMAVDVAERSIKWLRLYGADVHREAATLAQITGGKTDET